MRNGMMGKIIPLYAWPGIKLSKDLHIHGYQEANAGLKMTSVPSILASSRDLPVKNSTQRDDANVRCEGYFIVAVLTWEAPSDLLKYLEWSKEFTDGTCTFHLVLKTS